MKVLVMIPAGILMIRFVCSEHVIVVVEENVKDKIHILLEKNFKQLKEMRLLNGKQLNIAQNYQCPTI
jgi:agmatine deiminase